MVHVTNNDQTSTGIKPKNMLNPSMAKNQKRRVPHWEINKFPSWLTSSRPRCVQGIASLWMIKSFKRTSVPFQSNGKIFQLPHAQARRYLFLGNLTSSGQPNSLEHAKIPLARFGQLLDKYLFWKCLLQDWRSLSGNHLFFQSFVKIL